MEAPANRTEDHASFLGALAAFASDAAPGALNAQDVAASHDGLADDVAFFSYEDALRPRGDAVRHVVAVNHESAALEKDHKSASITIRMSHAECAQLRERAAAATLTVSAYMRSCVLEAETLRAQVKEALAELRAATPDEPRRAGTHAPRRWWRPWPHAGSRSTQA